MTSFAFYKCYVPYITQAPAWLIAMRGSFSLSLQIKSQGGNLKKSEEKEKATFGRSSLKRSNKKQASTDALTDKREIEITSMKGIIYPARARLLCQNFSSQGTARSGHRSSGIPVP